MHRNVLTVLQVKAATRNKLRVYSSIAFFFSCVHHQAKQLFHLTLRGRRIHTGQLEALPISDARVADDRETTIEQALAKIGIDAI